MYFWAKTTKEGKPGISVFEHMINVGRVAYCLAEFAPELLKRFQLNLKEVGALAALHDIGKISPGFQQKCETWLQEMGIVTIAHNYCWDSEMESDHGKISHAFIQKYFNEIGVKRKSAKYLSAILGGHHGRLNPPNDRNFNLFGRICEEQSGIDWNNERKNVAKAISNEFSTNFLNIDLDDSSSILWWLAGLTSVADWIGSDENYFPSEGGYRRKETKLAARKAVFDIGFQPPKIIPDLTFHDLFYDKHKPKIQFTPNDMQKKALSMISSPGVYIIEAPMGMGKTEAALGAAYQLLNKGKARGIYFALPTQITSNRIHLRMNDFVNRITMTTIRSRLIHCNSWLMDNHRSSSPAVSGTVDPSSDARISRDWFSSAKRALLAPFGVGTVDQALLGIVAAKHFFVRHFALAGKVVVLDEVHSYDLYTGTLIDKLITTLEDLGCTVIILSATLSGNRRDKIVSIKKYQDTTDEPYPLIIGRKEGKPIEAVAAKAPDSLGIQILFEENQQATIKAIEMAKQGGSVLWICNTIDAAQKQYQFFLNSDRDNLIIGLLHSRFTLTLREKLENDWMERLGKNSISRGGSILVSTQVVEQSVDLDADLLISELAPTDMLLQRIGRLWRHQRKRPDNIKPCLIILKEKLNLSEFRKLTPQAITKHLGAKALVYNPYILLRSLEVWEKRQAINIPSDIRFLIESTYAEAIDEPDSWCKLSDDRFASESGKKFLAARNCNFWQIALEDEEGVQTRLNEIPTLSLVLCNTISGKNIQFIDGSAVIFDDDFHIITAKAIHKNFVKVPAYHFQNIKIIPYINRYLHGDHAIGSINEDGTLFVSGLKNGVNLRWENDLGLVIEKCEDKEDE